MKEKNIIFERIAKRFFGGCISVSDVCYKHPAGIKKEYLPCHLEDAEWLKKMLAQELKSMEFEVSRKDGKVTYFSSYLKPLDISRFSERVVNSEEFGMYLYTYEQRLVKAMIASEINNTQSKVNGNDYRYLEDCDIRFRNNVFSNLIALGMNPEMIEEGLESNADMWRDLYMDKAFMNRFDSLFVRVRYPELPRPSEDLRKAFLEKRLYEYFQSHKYFVAKYGTPTEEMMASEDDYLLSCSFLDVYGEDRDMEVQKYMEEHVAENREDRRFREPGKQVQVAEKPKTKKRGVFLKK